MVNATMIKAKIGAALTTVALGASLVGVAFGQTYDTTTTTDGTSVTSSATTTDSSTTTPGLPDTGLGGLAATNTALLLSSGLILAGAVAVLARRQQL